MGRTSAREVRPGNTILTARSNACPAGDNDSFSTQIRQEAQQVLQDEPELCALLHRTVLAPGVDSFDDAVFATVAYRLLPNNENSNYNYNGNIKLSNGGSNPCVFSPTALYKLFQEASQVTEAVAADTTTDDSPCS